MTYSICCPEYFNLSSNPATSFFSLFTLLMRGLNEDNTTGLCFKMAGGHGFQARLAQRGRQPPLISAQDLCRAGRVSPFHKYLPWPSRSGGIHITEQAPCPKAGLCFVLSVNVCFLSLAFGKKRLQVLWKSCCCQGNGCKQAGSECLGCHLQLGRLGYGQPQTSAWGTKWMFLTRQILSSS